MLGKGTMNRYPQKGGGRQYFFTTTEKPLRAVDLRIRIDDGKRGRLGPTTN